MAGTLITYQGIPCRSVVFRRRRGYASDQSEVVIPARPFPGGFTWEQANPLGLGRRRREDPPDLAPLRAGERLPTLGLPAGLRPEGLLVMAQVTADGRPERAVPVAHLLVLRVDVEQRDDVGAVSWLRLTLVDERYLWARGVLARWSFNRLRADGTVARDSARPDGALYSRDQLLREHVAPGLFRAPTVSHVPERWRGDRRPLELAPLEAGVKALAELVREAADEDPCLRLDGTLAVHEFGAGKVGWAPGGKGPNDQDFPRSVLVYEDGRGQGYAEEAGFPEPYVVVVGRPTIATVAVDHWEPVVMVRGRPFLLSDEFVRKVTGGKRDLAWLQRFVLRPAADQADLEVPETVCRLFREQAYRMFRLRGAERIKDGWYTGAAGPNAHLLPLLARAETVGGRRRPVTVETYRWTTQRKHLAQSPAESAMVIAAQELDGVARVIQALAFAQGIKDPLGAPMSGEFLGFEVEGEAGLDFLRAHQFFQGNARLLYTDYNRKNLETYLDKARRIALTAKWIGGTEAQRYEAAYRKMLAAQDEAAGGTRVLEFELAKRLVELEQRAREARRPLESLEDALEPFRAAVTAAIQATLRRIRRKKQEDQLASQVGGRRAEKLTSAVVLRNLPREEDPGAALVDADAGVVRTAELAGHVRETDIPSPALTSLAPCPVRVLFGAELAPRTDAPPGAGPAAGPTGAAAEPVGEPIWVTLPNGQAIQVGVEPPPATTDPDEPAPHAVCPGAPDHVPPVLSDRQAHFVAAFRRAGRGRADRVELDAVPLDQALRVYRPWVRLLPLEGEGNVAVLERDALALAQQVFRRAPSVKGSVHKLAGPWPVQCDGVVAGVEIRSEVKDDAPCGFTTIITVGSDPPWLPERSRPRTNPAEVFRREAFRTS